MLFIFAQVSYWFVDCTDVAVAYLIKTLIDLIITFIFQVVIRVSAMALIKCLTFAYKSSGLTSESSSSVNAVYRNGSRA
jgi:hypothetical protein